MHTLSIVLEERDAHGDLQAYHKHELTDVEHILHFCHYILRTVDDTDMANAASALASLYTDDLREHMRQQWHLEDT